MGKKIKILIVEHDSFDLEIMHRELSKGGLNYLYEVVEEENSFFKSLSTYSPDIILSDYNLPKFSGLRAFELRQHYAADIPFILFQEL